jgi:hypothetical protein
MVVNGASRGAANTADSCAVIVVWSGQIREWARPGVRQDFGSISGHFDQQASTSTARGACHTVQRIKRPRQFTIPTAKAISITYTSPPQPLDLEAPGLAGRESEFNWR